MMRHNFIDLSQNCNFTHISRDSYFLDMSQDDSSDDEPIKKKSRRTKTIVDARNKKLQKDRNIRRSRRDLQAQVNAKFESDREMSRVKERLAYCRLVANISMINTYYIVDRNNRKIMRVIKKICAIKFSVLVLFEKVYNSYNTDIAREICTYL